MLRVVTVKSVVTRVVAEIGSAFIERGAPRLPVRIGYPGGNHESTVYWAADLGIWFAAELIDNNRYWNAFGTTDPSTSAMVNIVCEINFPVQGINRRVGGVVLEDSDGNLSLGHRGKIGGGRKGVGRGLFQAHFAGRPQDVIDGDQQSRIFPVAAMTSPRLLEQIQLFVLEVERIKQLVDQPNSSGMSSVGDEFEIGDIGDEFAGKKRYAISVTVEADCDHGIIVNTLRKLLAGRGYQVGKDQYRDLYVHKGQKVTSLFEVKPTTSTGSLYSAIGQLMFHGAGLSPAPGLFFVAPIELAADTRKKLKTLGIEVLGYRWSDGVPDFPDMAQLNF